MSNRIQAVLLFLTLAVASIAASCDRLRTAAQAGTPATSEQSEVPIYSAELPAVNLPAESGPPPAFDGSRAMQYVKDIVKFGPRPVGSENHKKVEDYLVSQLKNDTIEHDDFTADTPEGKLPVHNIIAKFPGAKDGIIILASHYDTNYPLRNIPFVGANDGGSSSALLLEIANQLRGKNNDGYSVWLVWDDAEESIKPNTEMPFLSDSLYGIKHLADKWQADGTLKKVKVFLLADMIGDADLNIDRELSSTPWLEAVIYQSATRLGYQSHFFGRALPMEDDHIPFLKKGVPSADLIDFTYGYNNVFWHHVEDTPDKLSPKSLEITGSVMLETIRNLDKMETLPPK